MGKSNTKMTISRKLKIYFCNRSIILILVSKDKITITNYILEASLRDSGEEKIIIKIRTSFENEHTASKWQWTIWKV